jgi:hypothetical protein
MEEVVVEEVVEGDLLAAHYNTLKFWDIKSR